MSYHQQRIKEIKAEQRLKNPPQPQTAHELCFTGIPNAFQVKTQKNRLHKLEKDIELRQAKCDELYDKYAKEFAALEQMQRAHKLLTEKNRFVVKGGKID